METLTPKNDRGGRTDLSGAYARTIFDALRERNDAARAQAERTLRPLGAMVAFNAMPDDEQRTFIMNAQS